MFKDIQQARVICNCEQCDGEIYEGNYYLVYDSCSFHNEDCLEEFVMEGVMSDAQEVVA